MVYSTAKILPIYLLLNSCLITSAALMAQENARVLTLDEALQSAWASSLDLKRQMIALDQARLDKEIVDRANDPDFAVTGTIVNRYTDSSLEGHSSANQNNYSAELQYKIWDFGRHAAQQEKSQYQINIQSMSAKQLQEDMRYRVVRAYHAVLAAMRIMTATSEQVVIMETKLAEQKRQYLQGIRPESDFVSAEVDLGKARLDLQREQANLLSARRALGFLVRCRNDPSCQDNKYDFVVDKNVLAEKSPADFDHMAQAMLVRQKQISVEEQIRTLEKESMRAEHAAIDAAQRPTVSVAVAPTQNYQISNPTSNSLGYAAQLQLKWDIPYNGVSQKEHLKIALREKDIELHNRSELDTRAENDGLAITQLSQNRILWEDIRQQQSLLQKQHELIAKRYASGIATILEVGSNDLDIVHNRIDKVRVYNTMIGLLIDIAQARAVTEVKNLFE